jgi:hypothetical protein
MTKFGIGFAREPRRITAGLHAYFNKLIMISKAAGGEKTESRRGVIST